LVFFSFVLFSFIFFRAVRDAELPVRDTRNRRNQSKQHESPQTVRHRTELAEPTPRANRAFPDNQRKPRNAAKPNTKNTKKQEKQNNGNLSIEH
jgi:hypothetical protein